MPNSLQITTAKTAAVGVIVVTYRPDATKLKALLAVLRPQVGAIVIVENTEASEQKSFVSVLATDYACELIELKENWGIAAAQNRGVQVLRQLPHIEYLLFLDQDSLPSSTMVGALLAGFNKQVHAGHRVGAVGPNSFVAKLGTSIAFINIGFLGAQKIVCTTLDQAIATGHLISSGTLTSLVVFNEVGSFREDLFIDYVDVEWCLRAMRQGYSLWGICAATMEHDLGDEPIYVFGRTFFAHSPLRHYYLIRNGITLYKASYISWRWKCSDAPRLLRKSIFYLILSQPRLPQIRMMGKGFWDGLCGRLGKLR
jgi:rhamnosyltransferase